MAISADRRSSRPVPPQRPAESGNQAPALTPEVASALAVLALSTDLEYWATDAADVAGRIGVLDLIRVLDQARASVKETTCFPA